MKTTLERIKKYQPCTDGWRKLCEGLGTSEPQTEVTILQILEINGVQDAFWALRTQDYRDYCLLLVGVAETILQNFEKEYPEDRRPREALEAIRKWEAGNLGDEELKAADSAADSAA
ncbi:MAG: hypothetical protein KAU20_01750, partial [Nanoarchaeota archaeon]|nr:hypothetical protein [Nanoarchaeota archaeon]